MFSGLRPPRRGLAELPQADAGGRLHRASPTARRTRTRASIASDLIAAYVDGDVDRVEIFYNHYISPLQQRVTRETLLPLQQASILEEAEGDDAEEDAREEQGHHRALVEYEPEPGEILQRLVPVYVEISIFRALLESTASEHGARMTAMRNASENAGELIDTYTLQMNRAAPGGHHAGDHGSRRRRREPRLRRL